MTHHTTALFSPRLLPEHAMAVARLVCDDPDRDWRRARAHLTRHGLGDARTPPTGATAPTRGDIDALIRRLQHLEAEDCLAYLATCDIPDATHLMWAAACHDNRIVADFATDVLVDAWFIGHRVTTTEVDAFVDAHRDEFLLPKTSAVRDHLMALVRGAGLLATNGTVPTVTLSTGLRHLLTTTDFHTLLYFPTPYHLIFSSPIDASDGQPPTPPHAS